jgi:flagellar biosynthesis regulator FlaF
MGAGYGIAGTSLVGKTDASAWEGHRQRLSLAAIAGLVLAQMQPDQQARAIKALCWPNRAWGTSRPQ